MIKTNIVKSGYGEITNGYRAGHRGLDIVGKDYTVDGVCAVDAGTVIEIGFGNTVGKDTRGRYLRIDHHNGFKSEYCHFANICVGVGTVVKAHADLGAMGNSGPGVEGIHVDFKIIQGNAYENYIDPTPYLNGFPTAPQVGYTGVIDYEVFTNRWLGSVNKVDNTDSGYAGVYGEPITGLRCKPANGSIIYQAHILGGDWLPEVSKFSDAEDGFAGNVGQRIDGIRIKSTQGFVTYRVHTIESGWLPWVSKSDNTDEGYAGIYGQTIDGIQMY